MLKISDVYNKDGAKRHHNFRHFRHFPGLSGLGCTKPAKGFLRGREGQFESNTREIDRVSEFNPTIIA